jgi:hypothetical protein
VAAAERTRRFRSARPRRISFRLGCCRESRDSRQRERCCRSWAGRRTAIVRSLRRLRKAPPPGLALGLAGVSEPKALSSSLEFLPYERRHPREIRWDAPRRYTAGGEKTLRRLRKVAPHGAFSSNGGAIFRDQPSAIGASRSRHLREPAPCQPSAVLAPCRTRRRSAKRNGVLSALSQLPPVRLW